MPILSMPSNQKFQKARFFLRFNTREFRSPESQAVQTLELVGARWAGMFQLPPMKRDQAEPWAAFLASLHGRAGRFYAGDPAGTTPQGVATGSPVVSGANQTGTSLVTTAWSANQTGILKAGDYIAWDTPSSWREMHKVTADANSTAGGNATLAITPPIRESPANNATIIVQSPTCVMMLTSDDEAAWDIEPLIYGIQFSAEEVFSATY